jgi:hypothetical protein
LFCCDETDQQAGKRDGNLERGCRILERSNRVLALLLVRQSTAAPNPDQTKETAKTQSRSFEGCEELTCFADHLLTARNFVAHKLKKVCYKVMKVFYFSWI